jgi:hypothetical protein
MLDSMAFPSIIALNCRVTPELVFPPLIFLLSLTQIPNHFVDILPGRFLKQTHP